MKRILCLLGVLLLFLFALCSCKDSKKAEYELILPENYLTFEKNEREVSELLGTDPQKLSAYLTERNVKVLGIDRDNTVQIKLIAEENEFSKKTVSFSRLTDTELNEIQAALGNNMNTKKIIRGRDGNTYLFLSGKGVDENGNAVQINEYTTVCSGKMYTLGILADELAQSPAEEIFSGLTVRDTTAPSRSKTDGLRLALIIAAIAAIAAITVFLIYTVIRDLLHPKTPNGENTPN